MSSRKNLVLALAAAALVAAGVAVPLMSGGPPASDADAASAPDGAPAPRGPDGTVDVRVEHGAVGGAGAPGAAAEDPAKSAAPADGAGPPRTIAVPDHGVTLRAQILDRNAADGEPVRARIWLQNVGREPVTICDPATDIARRVEILYRWCNVNYCASAPTGPVQPLDTTKLVEIPPGRALEAVVDLRPLFDAAVGFGEGPFRFRVSYRGDSSAVPQTVRSWNGDSNVVATSEDIVFHAPVPAWFEELGGDGELLNSLGSRVALWVPGSPDDEATYANVKSLGAPAIAALAIHASRIASPAPNAGPRASKCLRMLRRMGAEALPTLRKAPASPAVSMVIAMIEDDERERRGESAADASKPFRAIGGGTESGTTFTVSVMRPGMDGSVVYTYDASGNVLATRFGAGGTRKTDVLRLSTDQIVEIKRAILRSRPWTWTAVREVRRAGEGEVAFSLADPRGSMHWLASLRGEEARRANPFAADVLRAFRIAGGDAEDPEPAAPLPTPGAESPKRAQAPASAGAPAVETQKTGD